MHVWLNMALRLMRIGLGRRRWMIGNCCIIEVEE